MKKFVQVALSFILVVALIGFPIGKDAQAKLTSVKVVYFKPPQVGVTSTYKIDVDINQTVEIHGWITIVFPDEWTMPDVPKPVAGITEAESNELERILNSIYLATSPCTKCQGLPQIKTNKRTNPKYLQQFGLDSENSITFWSHIELEPNGPYDPIPITIASRAGFRNSMNPGKYRIGVRTHSEQDTVWSNEITVVKSQVEQAAVSLTNPAINEVSGYNIRFHVGEGGSLDRTTSRITMVFPKGTVFPESIDASLVKMNGKPLSVDPQVHQPSGTLSMLCPIDIDNLGEIVIDISYKAGIKNTPNKGNYSIIIKTDFEPEPVESVPFQIVRAGQKPLVVPPYTNQYASYKFSVDFPKTLSANDMIEILFPKEVAIPQYIKADAVLINDTPCSLRPGVIGDEKRVRVYAPTEIKPGSIMIEFTKEAKIKNPENPGTYQIKFSGQGVDGVFTTDPFQIFVKKLTIDQIKIIPLNAKENSSWELGGSLAYNGALEIGDKIFLEFPEGTIIPETMADCIVVSGNSTTAKGSGNSLEVTVPKKIESGEDFKISISKSCGIKNPPVANDNYIIKISTSKDPDGGVSEPFFIAPSLPVSTLLILKPSSELDENRKPKWVKTTPDGKNGWFKVPPSIDFEVDSPTAKIKIWWNDAVEKAIDWTIGKPLGIADQQRMDILHWQAIDAYGNEEVRSYEFKIDTNSPTISISEPAQKSVSLKTNKFTIVGLADPTELLKYEDKNNSPYIVPDVFINGEKIDVVQAKVVEMKDSGAILNSDAGVFKKEITLPKEGVYKFEIWAEDQAGWLSSKQVYTVTYDITPPEVKMLSPVYGDIYQVDDEVEVRFESDVDASLFVNNTIANVIEQIGEDKAIFSSFVKIINKGENTIEVKATDPAGNTKTSPFTIWGPIDMYLWIGQTTLMVNGKRSILKTAPVNTVPPLPSEAKNNTFIPLRGVVEALFAKIEWNDKTRTATVIQTIPGGKTRTIAFEINNPKAKIDGKEVLINAKGTLKPLIIKGSTMLPFRFVAEKMGGEVKWDANQKMITINYPPTPKKP